MPDMHQLAEAPVSITAHIRVPSISKDHLLVTGRGATADVAVANLHAAITAVQAPPHVASLPTPLAQSVGALVVEALTDRQNANFAGVARIAYAATLVLYGHIRPHQAMPDAYFVQDQCGLAAMAHLVTNTRFQACCDCRDWNTLRKEGFDCEHIIAVQWWQKLGHGTSPTTPGEEQRSDA